MYRVELLVHQLFRRHLLHQLRLLRQTLLETWATQRQCLLWDWELLLSLPRDKIYQLELYFLSRQYSWQRLCLSKLSLLCK
jgi:hypothetical protein